MRNIIVGTFAFVAAVAGISACGSNEQSRNKDGKTPAAVASPDLAQKAMVKSVAGSDAGMTSTQPGETSAPPKHMLVLGEDGGGFVFNAVTLSDDAKAKIDELFAKNDLKGAHFEIEGHTDNVGTKEVNDRVGLERAEAVRQYLCKRYEIPMDCISVISFGFDKPVADNTTDEGRAKNRRVVIKVVD